MIYRGYDIIETDLKNSSFTIVQNDKIIASGGDTVDQAMNKIDSIERERVANDNATIERIDNEITK